MLTKEEELFVHRRSVRTPSAAVMEAIRNLKPWMWSTFSIHGLTYQACRFCHQGGNGDTCSCSDSACTKLHGLWKYGVRHYICEGCRAALIARRPVRRTRAA